MEGVIERASGHSAVWYGCCGYERFGNEASLRVSVALRLRISVLASDAISESSPTEARAARTICPH